ncbi:MAG: HAMP domain-containing histidine kinase [Flavobacteriaceae bacterium]|nr:HAMP domain-containing histidine kinase [Flavobacteriaceae bacterium]
MNKRIFIPLIILMSIALIGIITVQIFWINNSIEIREKQFSQNVKSALFDVSKNIQQREFRDFFEENRSIFDQSNLAKKRGLREFYFEKLDTINNERFIYKQSILINNFKSPLTIITNDSNNRGQINFKSYFSKKEKEISSLNLHHIKDVSKEKQTVNVSKIGELSLMNKYELESVYKETAPSTPIYKRVSVKEIMLNVSNELQLRGIKTSFEFAMFDDDYPTKIKSDNFKKEVGNSYQVRIFENDLKTSEFKLFVNFPNKKDYILSAIKKTLIFASTFILFIILAFATALYQLLKQKKISEIKTDFINNMTHEFKTPIATINLALDAIKNPKIINHKESILRYAKIIREENKRMHAQVENVLRISRLEKNQLEISKEVIDIHDIIDEAITHVELLVNNKEGYIKNNFKATQSEVLGSELHLTNVLVNILDNALKYTNDAPKIEISTENVGKSILIKIKDQGIGMSKNVQKHVFEKFYREQKGNIHNVKGHGLGLSYVKSIVEDHQGNVAVESEKNKGSIFNIKLPVIN